MLLLLVASHLLWSVSVLGLWTIGGFFEVAPPWLSGLFMVVQLYAAAQLLLPALLLQPEPRSRRFYLFWCVLLASGVWFLNQLTPTGAWLLVLTALRSGLLLLVATLIGVALARYIRRLWELVPVCVVMSLADFYSWYAGPTAGFAEQIKEYYLSPEGPPPLIDMVLIKLAFPSATGLAPAFGLSDWIMVVFFAVVASRHDVNDNLFGVKGETLALQGRAGRYLPVSVVALFAAIVLAQTTGLFIPVLPLIALVMLLWYAARYAILQCRA